MNTAHAQAAATQGRHPPESDFVLRGHYRVQGARRAGAGSLQGWWLRGEPDLLDDVQINAALAAHPAWQGAFFCTLRAARVSQRQGEFADRPDILYKRSHFVPAAESAPMPCNIVDVDKSLHLWHQRLPYVHAWFGAPALAQAQALLGDIRTTIANEYFLHEAGHALGYDVERKTVQNYFCPGGQAAAMLIALEELRADLHAFGLALTLLPAQRAAAIFVYNLMLRLGVHLQGMHQTGRAPYGLIPYLLFAALQRLGLQGAVSGRCLSVPAILEAMHRCAVHALEAITGPQAHAADPIAAAMGDAHYVRALLLDSRLTAAFDAQVQAALARLTPSLLTHRQDGALSYAPQAD